MRIPASPSLLAVLLLACHREDSPPAPPSPPPGRPAAAPHVEIRHRNPAVGLTGLEIRPDGTGTCWERGEIHDGLRVPAMEMKALLEAARGVDLRARPTTPPAPDALVNRTTIGIHGSGIDQQVERADADWTAEPRRRRVYEAARAWERAACGNLPVRIVE